MTSDVFLSKSNQVRVYFRIVGGDISLPFVMEPGSYDEATMSTAAIERAKNIGCRLERYYPALSGYKTVYTPKDGLAILGEYDAGAFASRLSILNLAR